MPGTTPVWDLASFDRRLRWNSNSAREENRAGRGMVRSPAALARSPWCAGRVTRCAANEEPGVDTRSSSQDGIRDRPRSGGGGSGARLGTTSRRRESDRTDFRQRADGHHRCEARATLMMRSRRAAANGNMGDVNMRCRITCKRILDEEHKRATSVYSERPVHCSRPSVDWRAVSTRMSLGWRVGADGSQTPRHVVTTSFTTGDP